MRSALRQLEQIDVGRAYRRYGPWFALASGLFTVFMVRRGASFAPLALTALLGAWTITTLLGRFLPMDAQVGGWRRVARALGAGMVYSLYQLVLFFLLPIWFGSATWPSPNVAFPTLLTGMAVLSCFEHSYHRQVLERPLRRTVFSATVLFATLIPTITIATGVSPVGAVAGAAALASVVVALVLVPKQWLRSPRFLGALTVCSGAAVALVVFVAILLPPVPVQLVDGGIGTKVTKKDLVDRSDAFAAGIPRLYAWFAIAAPARYRQKVVFEWYRDGKARGRPFTTKIVGGRRAGFRTWAYVTRPRPGRWRVDLRTDSGQLIGRRSFSVSPPPDT